uniref:Glycogen debranching enzyme-like protein n=1 Tax=Solibacter usitatus (strain Ellin6076) TaxID=234267 RepID=Q02CJ9_SOLUE
MPALYLSAFAVAAQTNSPVAALQPIPRFALHPDPLTIAAAVQPSHPFTVAGPYGAIFGEQSGTLEAWLYPVKILSRLNIIAEIADYPVPIHLGEHATAIEVSPSMTTITYSHAAFTVKQRMFAARTADPAGMAILFEIAAVRPMVLTFQLQPDMLRMWPAPNFGPPDPEWVKQNESGYYILHTTDPAVSAAVAMPRARPGTLPPYQERPKTYPVELKLSFDPKTDSDLFFPLLIVGGHPNVDPAHDLAAFNAAIPRQYAETESYWSHFFDTRLTVETPDPQFDRALRWAEIAIDQGRVHFQDETGLIAGYYESGDSARPGFDWFFGRDALWTSFALNSYGDFDLTRQALDFLIRRQRSDGKIMHEYSQAADLVDWKSLPYFYAAADATPLFVMAMEDYVNTSGRVDYLQNHWDAVRSAWRFTRSHDSDGDGIYDNSEGTGWVESWPPGMPHQEIYLAALDQQAADSMSRLAVLMQDSALADAARRKAAEIRAQLESIYYQPSTHFYAFSRNAGGSLDPTATIFPSVAWWSGRLALARADDMLDRWASSEFSTDWGIRDVSEQTPFFDPISYHQGSVWPLFTGWVSLAEYRAGRSLAGYRHLMQNADLTWTQDPGAVTELLSGEFFQPLGRSSSHQIWSSAMVVIPALRGMFGLDWDALHHTLRVAPRLPAAWDRALLRNVPFGGARVDLQFTREGGRLIARAQSSVPVVLCLTDEAAPHDRDCHSPAAVERTLELPLPPVEVGIPHGLPAAGSRTGQLHVVSQRSSANRLDLRLAAPAGGSYDLPVRLNRPGVRVAGAQLTGSLLHMQFPAGRGYQHVTVSLSW